MQLTKIISAITLLGLCSVSTAADDSITANIRSKVSKVIGANVEIDRVSKSNYADLYEIITSSGIVYTDKNGSFVIFNAVVVDSKSQTNLSEKRMVEISKFNWSDLPLKDAIKQVNGNGKRVLATVEDPNCGFCKRLQPELQKLPDTTIYTFLAPVLGEDSIKKSKAIWCASDQAKAWTNFMRDGSGLSSEINCDTPLERNVTLAKKLRVLGTPAILFSNGDRIPGYTTSEKIELKFSAIK